MYFYGFANFSSMDVSAGGYSVIPSFTVGYAMKNLYLTFKGEASVMTLLSRQVSDIEVETSKFKLYGWRGSFIIEQPVYGDTNLLLAFKINYKVIITQVVSLYNYKTLALSYRISVLDSGYEKLFMLIPVLI